MRAVNTEKLGIMKLLFSAFVAVIVSLCLILIFALLIKFLDWGDAIISPVNIGIKIISIAVGVLVATKRGERAVVKGALVGVFYIILSFVCFSAMLGSFSLAPGIIGDILLGLVAGSIMGVVSNIIFK